MSVIDDLKSRLPTLVSDTWDLMLSPGDPLEPSTHALESAEYEARVEIYGTSRHTLCVECHPRVAARVAEGMFAREAESLSQLEMLDAMCEFANLLGGNTKAILAPGGQLGLPHATKVESAIPSRRLGKIDCETGFSWHGGGLRVYVQRRPENTPVK